MASQRDPKFILRYSEELRQRVAASAKANSRSINAEITFQLQRAYDKDLWIKRETAAIERAIDAIDGRPDRNSEKYSIDRMDSMAGNS